MMLFICFVVVAVAAWKFDMNEFYITSTDGSIEWTERKLYGNTFMAGATFVMEKVGNGKLHLCVGNTICAILSTTSVEVHVSEYALYREKEVELVGKSVVGKLDIAFKDNVPIDLQIYYGPVSFSVNVSTKDGAFRYLILPYIWLNALNSTVSVGVSDNEGVYTLTGMTLSNIRVVDPRTPTASSLPPHPLGK